MRLSDYDGMFYQVIKDGEFETLGNYATNPGVAYLSFAESTIYLGRVCKKDSISCVICTMEMAENEELKKSGKGIAVADSPRRALYKLHNWLAGNNDGYIQNTGRTVIGRNCTIHPTAIISESNVTIGNNVTVEENVVIKSNVVIGDNVSIGMGSIIGGENQVVTTDENGNLFLVKQVGRCRICNNVDVGYQTLIAKGSFPYEETYIGEYSKIETGVEISHNSKIGKNCVVSGQAQICGNTSVEDNLRMKPQSIVANRLKIGDCVTVGIGAVVVNNLKDSSHVSGNFAIDHSKFLFWHRKKLHSKNKEKS